MYPDLASQPRILATVVRGYITRYMDQPFWSEELVALPPGTEPEDSDAVPHYQRNPADGRFYEYLGFNASTLEHPLYVVVADHISPTLTSAGERAGLPLFMVDGPGDIACPLCGSSTEHLQLKGMRAYRCLTLREPACADGFFVLDRTGPESF